MLNDLGGKDRDLYLDIESVGSLPKKYSYDPLLIQLVGGFTFFSALLFSSNRFKCLAQGKKIVPFSQKHMHFP